MIIREILTDTDEILKTFDFFNDYQDTLNWLKETGEGRQDAAMARLKLLIAHHAWRKRHRLPPTTIIEE